MTIQELERTLSAAFPSRLSCSWDNDGLMAAGDLTASVFRVLVSLDATEQAVRYAADHGFDVLLTHHPLLFRGAKSITPETVSGRRVAAALSSGVRVLSYHTRLDAAEGGVNDALCRTLGLTADGTFGDEESPSLGRLAVLSEPTALSDFAWHVKNSLSAPFVRLTAVDPGKRVTKIAVCGGDGKDFTEAARAAGAEVFLTGASGYNMAEDAAEMGLATIEAGHYHTEFPVCAVLARNIEALGLPCAVYESCLESVF